MRTLIESTQDELPDDIQQLNASIREERSQLLTTGRWASPGKPLLAVPGAPPMETTGLGDGRTGHGYALERWLIQAHTYGEEQAAKVSLLGRLFSGDVQRVKAGVVHDAKRFSIVKTEESGNVEIGVAVRLSVATSRVDGKFELTLPNLAADAQLHGIDARVGITVLGFTGPLGEILPAPRRLDVETCAEYMDAFRKIQAFIFGREGWSYVVPTALSYEA